MVLEATVVCLDNSEWMRNGDYLSNTRLEAQQDAVNIISAAKTQSNPESTVAVMTMSQSKGIRSEVLVSLTQDLGKILSSLHTVKIGGRIDFSAAMQVAQLVLKHRQNKNQHQRIIVFVGSPILENADELVKLAKKMKKNNVAIDVINFGEEAENVEKLEAFINAVNTNEESHLITIPAGPHILSDIILSSPVVIGEGGGGGFGAAAAASAAAAAAAASGATGGEFDFGVDPSLDPELAMALRISMEEERARQEAAKKEGGDAPAATPAAENAGGSKDVEMSSEDDDDLQQALAMSMGGNAASGSAGASSATSAPMELSEDEQMQMALSMSMGGGQQQQTNNNTNTAALGNQDFLNSVLSSLPGVDPNDERIRNVLQSIQGEKKDEKKDEKKEEKKEEKK